MQSFVLRPTQFSDYSGSESESEVDSAPQPGTPALSAYTSAYISAMSSAEAAGDAALLASHSATVSTPAVYKAPQLSRTTPCGWIPNHTMTEKILRARFAVPPEQAIDLSILPDTDDPSVKRWPDVHDILQITIFGAPGHKLASGGIFKALKARFRYYRELSSTEDMVWKMVVRARLHNGVVFIQLDSVNRRPRQWTLDMTRVDTARGIEKIPEHQSM